MSTESSFIGGQIAALEAKQEKLLQQQSDCVDECARKKFEQQLQLIASLLVMYRELQEHFQEGAHESRKKPNHERSIQDRARAAACDPRSKDRGRGLSVDQSGAAAKGK
jgi:hypothetical protein